MDKFWALTALIITGLIAVWLAISLIAAFLLYLFAVICALTGAARAAAQVLFKSCRGIYRNIESFFANKS